MIRKIFASIVTLTTLISGGVVFAQAENLDVMNLPKLEQYVTDFAGVLDTSTLAELNEHAYKYEQTSGHQFVAVLIPDRQGKELFDIALNVFNDNGIGAKQKNDGLLLVIATDEKKIRIMVGYGLEAEMPDVLASKIIEESIRPLVNSGDYAGAVRAFYARAEQAIASGEGKQVQSTDTENKEDSLWFFLAVGGFMLGRSIKSMRGKGKKKGIASIIPGIIISLVILVAGIAVVNIAAAIVLYIFGGIIGFFLGGGVWFLPSGPRGGFGGGSFGGGGSSFGGFSGGGGMSGGGGAGD